MLYNALIKVHHWNQRKNCIPFPNYLKFEDVQLFQSKTLLRDGYYELLSKPSQ